MPAQLTPDDLILLNRSATVAWSLASATHSVNNSLLVVSGTVELLEMGPPTPDGHSGEALQRIRANTEAAAETIREVMLFARADLAAETRLDLQDVASRAVEMRRFSTRRAGCQLRHDPVDATPMPVRGNPALLLQALLNLIVNAEQAVAGTAGASIAVSVQRDVSHAAVRVSDSGGGVPAADRERIFEPWVTTRDRRQHSGLGLAVARHIAERHGGTVTLDADGKTFVVWLPLAT